MGRPPTRVLHDDGRMRIIRRRGNGRKEPALIKIEIQGSIREPGAEFNRSMHLSIDELFDLTEALDDICDDIEDNG